jgi:hypothetical protein
MRSRFVRGGVIGTLTALLVGLLPALPAFAALNGTSSITSAKDLLAGRQHDITFRVNNPSTATAGLVGETQPDMNFVRILPASGFAISCPTDVPAGWNCRVTNNGFADFSDANPDDAVGIIEAGANQSFTIAGSAPRPGNDQTRTWRTQMSANDGDEFVTNDPSTPGALDTTVRVLQVVSVLIADPAGAVDNTVTSGQNNTFVDVTVINAGSADKETTATLTSPSGSDGVRGTPPPSQPIPAYNGINDGDATFTFGFNFGNTGTRRLTGDATATGANAFEIQSANIVVQTPKNITYSIGSLQPIASRSEEEQTFTLGFNITGDPSARDLAGTLDFRRNDGAKNFSADLTSPTSYPEGSSSQAHDFGPVLIPGTAEAAQTGDPLNPNNFDGDYDLSVSIDGTDGNDAVIDLDKSVNDIFTIDNLVPGVVPLLSTPNREGQVGVTRPQANADPTRAYVVKDGQTINVGGNITKSGESETPDTTATVIKCELRVFNEAGTQTGNFPQPRTSCRENGIGGLTGSFSVPVLGVPSGTARLYVEVQDRVDENVGSGLSAAIIVDNVIPVFGTGSTGCRGLSAAECMGGELRTVQVPTTEVVTGEYLALEFTCTDDDGGNVVTNADFNGDTATYGNRVILTLVRDMDVDAQPQCQYARPDLAAAPLDSPTNEFIDLQDLDIIDDIAPDLPFIDLVDGNTAYLDDGLFYTNDSTPEVTLAGLRPEYIGIVARETNGTNGYQFGSDQELCRFGSEGESGSCSTSDLGGDGTKELYGASLDARGNVSFDKDGVQVGNGTPFELVLDRVAPEAATALVNKVANTITVTFDEKLDAAGDQQVPDPDMRGRNSAQDWAVRVRTADGELVLTGANTVSDDGFDKKVLNMPANDSVWTGSTAVTEVRYGVETNQTRRFTDRAGNLLTDFPPGAQPTIT